MSLNDARAFAESVAGVLGRHGPDSPQLDDLLNELGWGTLSQEGAPLDCAGLGAAQLGRKLAPLHQVDRLLGGGPMAGELVRSLGPERVAVEGETGYLVQRSERVASTDGVEVHRVLELGEAVVEISPSALAAWRAASVGYLAGLGQGALDLTVEYVRQRRAFGSTLAAVGPVQQLIADAATRVDGVRLLAGESPDEDALAYAGPAISEACEACHQVTGAIGFTLEYPLHRYTQRSRALAVWHDALLD